MFFDTPNESDSAFVTVPPGTYKAMVSDSEGKQTTNGNGRFIEVAFKVLEGEYRDQQVFARYNIQNPSAQATKIGKAQLKKLLMACGVTQALPNETDLHRVLSNKVVLIEVTNREYNGNTYADVKNVASASIQSNPGTPQQAKPAGALDNIPF